MSGRKNTSVIWNYFNVVNSFDKLSQCDSCGQKISGSITNLKTHLNRKHPTINLKFEIPANKPQLSQLAQRLYPNVEPCHSADMNSPSGSSTQANVNEGDQHPEISNCGPNNTPPPHTTTKQP